MPFGLEQLSPHDLRPASVLRSALAMSGAGQKILLVGCEPESFGTESEGEGRMGLSPSVAAAVDGALALIESLLVRAAHQEGLCEET